MQSRVLITLFAAGCVLAGADAARGQVVELFQGDAVPGDWLYFDAYQEPDGPPVGGLSWTIADGRLAVTSNEVLPPLPLGPFALAAPLASFADPSYGNGKLRASIEVGNTHTGVSLVMRGNLANATMYALTLIAWGGDGTLNKIWLEYPDGEELVPRNKDLITGVAKGTVYRQYAGGGGGFGDPKKRDANLVAAEVRNGVISADAARDVYGVAVTGEDCAVDGPATATLRKQSSSPRFVRRPIPGP